MGTVVYINNINNLITTHQQAAFFTAPATTAGREDQPPSSGPSHHRRQAQGEYRDPGDPETDRRGSFPAEKWLVVNG